MATQTLVMLIDDLDGSSGDDTETIEFGIDGIDYTIDLRGYNAEKLREVLRPYVAAARRTEVHRPARHRGARPERARPERRAAPVRRTDGDEVREWAKQAGYTVSDRGRIPIAVQTAYDETHGVA